MRDVHTIDLNFQGVPQSTAVYLIEGDKSAILVETGPGSTLTALKEGMQQLGYKPEDVKYVFLTHIHLDHAGAAGWWAKQGAHIYVHHIGARHLIDPSRLISSATRIYGDEMDILWGEMLPVPAEQLTELHDGDVIEVDGVRLKALDTPGHAYHHMAYKLGDIALVGDVGGNCVPGFAIIDFPAPPPEVDIEAWHVSIQKVRAENFSTIYPTHFGAVENVSDHLSRLDSLIDEAAGFVRGCLEAGMERDEIVTRYLAWSKGRLEKAGLSDEVIHQYQTSNPNDMSVNGIIRYWRKKWEREQDGR